MEEDQLIACRICQSYSIIFINLFEAETDKDLVNLIEEVIGVELLKGSGIPTTICTQCHSDFLTAQGFRQRCIDSNKFFSTQHDLSPIKTEIDIKDEEINEPQTDFEDLVEFSDEEYTPNPTDDKRCSVYDQEIPKRDPDTVTNLAEPKAETTKNNKLPKKEREFNLNRKQRLKSTCPIVCDICGNVFKSKNVFALHLRRHNNNKPYDCELCTSRFFTNSELTRHMRRHTGEKPYQCKHCERRFSDYGTLIKHQRTHTNDRPYSCQQCGKSFICGFVLKNHMLTHTGERAFNCEVCNKSFGRQHNLTTHMKSIYHQKNAVKIAADELDII